MSRSISSLPPDKAARQRRLGRMQARRWRRKNKEHYNANARAYYAKNRERILARTRARRAANPERHRAADRRYRAKKKAARAETRRAELHRKLKVIHARAILRHHAKRKETNLSYKNGRTRYVQDFTRKSIRELRHRYLHRREARRLAAQQRYLALHSNRSGTLTPRAQ